MTVCEELAFGEMDDCPSLLVTGNCGGYKYRINISSSYTVPRTNQLITFETCVVLAERSTRTHISVRFFSHKISGKVSLQCLCSVFAAMLPNKSVR